MKYGEKRKVTYKNSISGEKYEFTETYKYASWREYHTNNNGDGLWCGDKQILGTCQFTVSGCETEKVAVSKIRKYANSEV